jgi:hypothetical protein
VVECEEGVQRKEMKRTTGCMGRTSGRAAREEETEGRGVLGCHGQSPDSLMDHLRESGDIR